MNSETQEDKNYSVIEYINGSSKGLKVYYENSELQRLIMEGQIGPFEKILAKNISLKEANKLILGN